MKAWQQDEPAAPLRLVELSPPVLQPGGALLDVVSAQVPAYTDVLVAGGRGGYPTPIVLGGGGIGRVVETADDVFAVQVGDVVLGTGLFRSGRLADPQEAILSWTGVGAGNHDRATTERMRQVWRNGFYAQQTVQPERVLVTLPGAADHPDLDRLAFLGWLAIAGEAVHRSALRAGHTVLVGGATGQLGGASVLLALAAGAAAVVAYGRNRAALDRLAALDPRVVPVPLTGDREEDARALRAAAGPVDVAVDAFGDLPDAGPSMAVYDAVRLDGTLTLVGGVRRQLPIRYDDLMHRRLTLRGSWMFPPERALAIWSMIRAGVLDLDPITVVTIGLDDPAAALRAAHDSHGLTVVVLHPAVMSRDVVA